MSHDYQVGDILGNEEYWFSKKKKLKRIIKILEKLDEGVFHVKELEGLYVNVDYSISGESLNEYWKIINEDEIEIIY